METNNLSCQSNLKYEEQSWSITLSDVKMYYKTIVIIIVWLGFPSGSMLKNPPANSGDMGLIPDPGRCYMLWSK